MRRSFVTAAVTAALCAAFFAMTPSVFAGDDKPEAKNIIIYPDTGLTVSVVDTYVPASTRVAILPAVDRTGERAENRREGQARAAYENMLDQFKTHGFQVVPQDEVNAAVAKSGIDLNDDEEYRRDNFYGIADAVGADLVIFAVVTDATQDVKKAGIFSSAEKQGRSHVKFWLLDAKKKRAIYSAVVKEGKAAGKSKLFATNEGSNRQINSVGNAVKELLDPFMRPYGVK